jgi:hypothetical protein
MAEKEIVERGSWLVRVVRAVDLSRAALVSSRRSVAVLHQCDGRQPFLQARAVYAPGVVVRLHTGGALPLIELRQRDIQSLFSEFRLKGLFLF